MEIIVNMPFIIEHRFDSLDKARFDQIENDLEDLLEFAQCLLRLVENLNELGTLISLKHSRNFRIVLYVYEAIKLMEQVVKLLSDSLS